MIRKVITTKEICELYGKPHRVMLDKVSELISSDSDGILTKSVFIESYYTTQQNKKIKCYEMGADGFCLLTDSWGFSRGESAMVKARILSDFGEKFVVTGSPRNRFEDDFYAMISGVFHKTKIIRQFPIAGFRADFYFPEYAFFVEYDEEGHFSKSARDNDKEREDAIIKFYKDEFDDGVTIIRVNKGDELAGISSIAGTIALLSPNATGLTIYAND